jgi:tetratricopeptide (TPR) repeat protein
MMIKKIGLFVGALLLFVACSTNKEVVQMRDLGNSSFTEGDYTSALNEFTELINAAEQNGGLAKLEDYEGAGKSAHALGMTDKALAYFEKAKDLKSADELVYYGLADIYHLKENISKEIRYLEYYQKEYPTGTHFSMIQIRLFEAYIATESWEQGQALWPQVKDNEQFYEVLVEGYFKINMALKNDEESQKLAKELLKINDNNKLALEYNAKHYFWKAENLYQGEMAAYNKKKTNSQYAKLLMALNVVTVDFKRSRDYFEKLYKAEPLKEYARFLGNIYARLDDKAKSRYYKSKSQ